MKMSEKFKIEEEDKIFRRRSHSYVEERFFQMTKILDFAAICNEKRFSEWTHQYFLKNWMLSTIVLSPIIHFTMEKGLWHFYKQSPFFEGEAH